MIAPVALPVPVSLPADSARSESDTGTIAVMGSSGRACCSSRYSRKAPDTMASTTSLSVVADDLATRWMRSISHDWAANRRAPPIEPLRIVLGARGSVMSPSRMIWLAILRPAGRSPAMSPAAPAPVRTRASGSKPFLSPRRLARRQRPRGQAVAGIRVLAERALHEPQRRDAVDHRVVDLGVDRDPAVLQALDDVHLPQRSVPVQQRAVPPRRQLQQLADPARAAARRSGVRGGRSRSSRRTSTARAHRLARPLAEQRRDVVGLPVRIEHVPRELRTRPVRRHEQLQPADMHRMVPILCQQEHRVRRRHERHRQSSRKVGRTRSTLTIPCGASHSV